MNLLARKCLNVHFPNYMHRDSAYLICLLEMQMTFHFIFSSNAESLCDCSRILGDWLGCHCRVIALTFSSSHRDGAQNETVLKEDTITVG